MASIKTVIDAHGNTVYKVQVSNGRGRRVTRTWRPEPGWSAKTIKNKLDQFAANLTNELADGTVKTKQEELEEKRKAAIEAAKLKTMEQYATGVFMPAKFSIAENTRYSYQTFLDKHIFPKLGDILLTEISTAMIDKLLLDFQGEGYSHSTAIKLYNVLNGVFKAALMDDTIKVNPMLKVTRPTPRKDENFKDERDKAYTPEELRYILSCVDKEPMKWRVFICLCADAWIRRGEECGLQWEDIDFKKCTITIRRNLQYTAAKGVYETTPKNGKSRIVDIGQDTVSMLQQWRAEQAKTAISKWVFTQENSPDPMHPQTPTRYFKKFEKKYGVKDFHPHKLRHTAASIAVANGADIVGVSERLGHSDTAVTLRVYTHGNAESIHRAGQAVRDALKAQGE